MNLLQKLVSGIKSSVAPDIAHTVAAGQKFSPAVQTNNHAPIQNQFNAQGQPTYEVLSNDAGAHMLPRPMPNLAAHFNAYQPQGQTLEARYGAYHPVSQLLAVKPQLPTPQPNLGIYTGPIQGRPNPGYVPLQVGGMGRQGNPQYGAFNGLQSYRHQNPQVRDDGYYFDN